MNELGDQKRSRTSAAVLVLTKGDLSSQKILLIERSATVKTHQSQVAFPGGGMESHDENDPIRTALRECFEEVGIPPTSVKVINTLPPLPTLTSGFFVVPVIGIIENTSLEISLALDHHEVAYAEWVSVEALLRTKTKENGLPVFFWNGADQKNRKVWGLTAIIIDLIFHPVF